MVGDRGYISLSFIGTGLYTRHRNSGYESACPDNFPTLEDPDKVYTMRLQRLHGINTERHVLKLAFAPILLNNLAHNGRFVGSAKTSVRFAVKVARPVQSGVRKSDQSRCIMLDDSGNRDDRLTDCSIRHDTLGSTYPNIGLAAA